MHIFVGYDAREHVAWEVCRASLNKHSKDLDIAWLNVNELTRQGHYTRTWHMEGGVKVDDLDGRPFSTDFAFTRFLIPHLQGYRGWAMFCDCDFLFRANVKTLFAMRDDKYAAMVVKHDYSPKSETKMDGQVQQSYPRKNWSSLILWNCGHLSNRALTKDVVNSERGSYLHGFGWLLDEEIGSIPEHWNWLPNHSPKIEPRAVHFTEGGPWFDKYQNVPYAEEWISVLGEIS